MSSLAFIVWNVNPDFLDIGKLSIRWYGVLYAVAFYVGYKIMKNLYQAEKLNQKEVDRLTWHLALGIIIGSRLGFMILHSQENVVKQYWDNPLDILKIWEGGLSSYGAAVGILIAMYIYTRKGKVRSFLWIMDRVILVVIIGAVFIRMGNLINSEIYGVQTNLPWGFKFIKDSLNIGKPVSQVIPHHPTQIYESLLFLVLYIVMFRLFKNKRKHFAPGTILGIALIGLFSIRFCIEFIKEPQVSFNYAPLTRYGINMSHILSFPFILFGIIVLIYSTRLQKGKTVRL